MTPFATPPQLASFLQVETIDTFTADLLLDLASEAIRDATGQAITRVYDDTVTFRSPAGTVLRLPQRPADPPTAVTIDGQAATGWTAVDDRLYLTTGWGTGGLNGAPSAVTVTYSHGYVTIPGTIRKVCLQLATRAYANPVGARQAGSGAVVTSYGDSLQLSESELRDVLRALGQSSAFTIAPAGLRR